MFWDRVAWVYDVFARGINRKANQRMCAVVGELISPMDEVLECACGTGLLSGSSCPGADSWLLRISQKRC